MRITVIGTGLSGHACARRLRELGFDGELVLVGQESHRPYDRPPLSKDLLKGTISPGDLALESADEDLAATWHLGVPAVGLAAGADANARVLLADGSDFESDTVVIASGTVPRTFATGIRGLHTLHTLDDALNLQDCLSRTREMAVVGTGFVGLEVASTAAGFGVGVTVLSGEEAPLSGMFGPLVADAMKRLHEANGVTFRCGSRAAQLDLDGDAVRGVVLEDGSYHAASTVFLGIGAEPATGWLHDSPLELTPDGAIACDAEGRTSLPGVFAIGDCAAWWEPEPGNHVRCGHWTLARTRAHRVAATVLEQPPVAADTDYLWTDQYGVRIQFAGRLRGGETATVVMGSAEGQDLFVTYHDGLTEVAAFSMNQPRAMMRWRKTRRTVPLAA